MSRANTFRIQSRYVLLTYSQANGLDPASIAGHLDALGGQYIIGRENHLDGGIHFHAFVDFGRKFSSRDVHCFDVDEFHPNVLRGYTTPEKMWDYATKDQDVVAGELQRPDGEENKRSPRRDGVWREIIAAPDRQSFFDSIAQLDPRSLVVNYIAITKYADDKYRPRDEPYSPPTLAWDDFAVSSLQEWVQLNVHGWEAGTRKRSLILYGPSRTGKTMWARSHGPHFYFGGLFNLDQVTDTHVTYGVFDDISGGIEFFPSYKSWLGHQQEFTCTDKYRGKKRVYWGKPAIYLCNNDPRDDKGADRAWLEANCDFHYIEDKLF
ncbi:replication-associated protein [Blackfly genomovirus 8]|uniref:Replication-associated protein n=1 Tax=Blackfly genomovirus 8 TaxID=2586207 RepID=A0A4Y5QLV7_9VIRU|nr:replication-associated protein [Blackfly genomovirus 8]QCX35071.1 replication-associated protein [Blackfly genomovirus 8]